MDCTFLTNNGKFNFRVSAIIADRRKVLMARNPNEKRKFYYSVGGRVKFGESLTDAVLREVKEETNIDCEIERLACIHENFFTDDNGIPFHEISSFFLIKSNEKLLQINNGHETDHGPSNEYLEWIDLDNCDNITIYPEFYKNWDFINDTEVRHFVTKDN